MVKSWHKSRTLWLMAVVLLMNILAVPEFIAIVPASAMPYFNALGAVLGLVLRFDTTQSLK